MQIITSTPFFRSLIKVFPLIVVSRFILTLCGFLSTKYLEFFQPRPFWWNPTGIKWLDIWGFGDTGWYLNIARNGYSSVPVVWAGKQANIGFFPFYPKLIYVSSFFIKNHFLAGLLLSNLMLLIGCCYLFMLLERVFYLSSPVKVIVWFLAIPGAFMLSAVLSESTLFCMSVMSFYYSYKDNWMKAGIFGGLAALTKPSGAFIVISLFIIYIKRYGFSQLRRALYLILIPFGTFCFGVYCYLWHNDFLAYVHIKKLGWGTYASTPWHALYTGITSTDAIVFWNSIYTVMLLILLVAGIKILSFELWIYSLIQIIFPLVNGAVNLVCMFRYTIIIFPLAIILYRLKLPEFLKVLLATVMVLMQLLFMISFSNCFDYIG